MTALLSDAVPASLLTEATIAAYLTDLQAGALPTPVRPDRWVPLRAGVVNMWEFEVAEFSFADGRCQMYGANENGKSTLQTLTTLILLTGDTRPRNIDTFGGSSKKFRYFVEPSESDDDRRDASNSANRGWTWMEFGRLTPLGPQYVTCALYAQARRTSPSVDTTWLISTGARVREELSLMAARAVTTPDKVHSLPGVQTFRTGEVYRRELARTLFGSPEPDRLDTLVQLLRLLRTPNLGSKLSLNWLSDKLRLALPPLTEHEVKVLADGWDELDQLSADRDSVRAARDAVDAYRSRSWQPWVSMLVRRHADALTSAVTEFDNVTKDANAATEKLTEATAAHTSLHDELEGHKTGLTQAKIDQDAWRQSIQYQDASDSVGKLGTLDAEIGRLTCSIEQAGRRVESLEARVTGAQETLAGRHEAVCKAAEAVDAALQQLHGAARSCGLGALAEQVLPDDVDRLLTAGSDRARHIAKVQELLAAADEQQEFSSRVGVAEATQRKVVEVLTGKLADAEASRDSHLQRLVDELSDWTSSLPDWLAVPGAAIEQWTGQLTALRDEQLPARSLLSGVVRSSVLEAARTGQVTERTRAHDAADAAGRRATQLQRDIEQVQAQTDPTPPPPVLYTRRARPAFGAAGAALWRLLDPVADLPGVQLDLLEAALAAVGLLDAWVSPDGTYVTDRDGTDVVVQLPDTPTQQGTALWQVLAVAHDAGALTGPVQRLLGRVELIAPGTPMPTSSPEAAVLAVSTDGRFVTGTSAGTAEAAHEGASLLGAAARAAARARRLETLRLELATAESDRISALAAEQRAELALAELTDAERRLPDDDPLVRAVRETGRLSTELSAAETELDKRSAAVAAASAELDRRQALCASAAAEHALPLDGAALKTLGEALTDLRVAGLAARERLAGHRRAEQELPAAERHVTEREEDLRLQQGEQSRLARDLAGRNAEHLALTERLNSTDGEALDRMRTLDAAVVGLEGKIEDGTTRLGGLLEAQLKAKVALNSVEQNRQITETKRASAHSRWLALVATGLPTARGVALSGRENLRAARDDVRSARSLIGLQNWPADSAQQDVRVQQAFNRMTGEQLAELRATLEATSGRTARLVPEDDPTLPDRLEIVVDGTGRGYLPSEAVGELDALHDALSATYNERLNEALHELLGSAFMEHMHERLGRVNILVASINAVLEKHPTGTSRTTLRLTRTAVDGHADADRVLQALDVDLTMLPEQQEAVRRFLQSKITDAQVLARSMKDDDWTVRLREELDYRSWFTLEVQRKVPGGQWAPLTASHSTMSGGAAAVTLMLPLLAALDAVYAEMPGCPRQVWMDEFGMGLDPTNQATVLHLLGEFDLDWLIVAPGPVICVAPVPSATLYQVARAPHPLPGADLAASVWAGNVRHEVDLPDPVDLATKAARRQARAAQLAAGQGDATDLSAHDSADIDEVASASGGPAVQADDLFSLADEPGDD